MDERRNEILQEIDKLQRELVDLQEEIEIDIQSKALPPLPGGYTDGIKARTSFSSRKSRDSAVPSPINTLEAFEAQPHMPSSADKDRIESAPARENAISRRRDSSAPELSLIGLSLTSARFSSPDRPPSAHTDGSARGRKISTMTKDELLHFEMINTGKKKFNLSPRSGIQYLVDNRYFATSEPSPLEIARFFYQENDTLSKWRLGDYLGDSSEFHIEVLREFVRLHEFEGLSFVAALRLFLKSFRLPGEAQKIDRVMEAFASQFISCNPGHRLFRSTDTVYILAFSVIMLNTDLHNPAVKNKIKKKHFVRNNLEVIVQNDESINSESDSEGSLPSEYLEEIYDDIKAEPLEFVDPENDDPLNNNPFYFTFINPEREGWLIKQGGRIKTWKRRYCILTGSCLYYFKSDAGVDIGASPRSGKGQQPCGIIPLENLQVEPLDVIDGSTGQVNYFFRLHNNAVSNSSPRSSISDDASANESRSSPSLKFFRRIKNTIKAAKTGSDGKIVEGRHSDYLFMCSCEDARNDWIQSVRGQMSKPSVYTLYEQRKIKLSHQQYSSELDEQASEDIDQRDDE